MNRDRLIANIAYLNMNKDLLTAGFSAAEITAILFTQFGCKPQTLTIPEHTDSKNPNVLIVEPTEATKTKEQEARFYSGRISYGNNGMVPVVSGEFKINPNNIETFSFFVTSFSGEGEKEIKFAYATEDGSLRRFVMTAERPEELKTVIEDGFVHEYYELKDGTRYDIHIYPEDSYKLFSSGTPFTAHVFPPDNLLLDFPGLNKNSISIKISSESGKVYATVAKNEAASLPDGEIKDFAEKIKGSREIRWSEDKKFLQLVDKKTDKIVPDFKFDITTDPLNPTWTREYKFEGETITILQNLSTIVVDSEKNIVDIPFPGYVFDSETNTWNRKEFEGEPVLNTDEAKIILIKYSDVTNVQYDVLKTMFLVPGGGGHPRLVFKKISELTNRYAWGEKFIPIKNPDDSYEKKPTGMFKMCELADFPYSFATFKDKFTGEYRIILIDKTGLIVEHPTSWSNYYLDNPTEK